MKGKRKVRQKKPQLMPKVLRTKADGKKVEGKLLQAKLTFLCEHVCVCVCVCVLLCGMYVK